MLVSLEPGSLTVGHVNVFDRKIHDGRVLFVRPTVLCESFDVKNEELRKSSDTVPFQLIGHLLHPLSIKLAQNRRQRHLGHDVSLAFVLI